MLPQVSCNLQVWVNRSRDVHKKTRMLEQTNPLTGTIATPFYHLKKNERIWCQEEKMTKRNKEIIFKWKNIFVFLSSQSTEAYSCINCIIYPPRLYILHASIPRFLCTMKTAGDITLISHFPLATPMLLLCARQDPVTPQPSSRCARAHVSAVPPLVGSAVVIIPTQPHWRWHIKPFYRSEQVSARLVLRAFQSLTANVF